MRILITGATGFVGRHLRCHLRATTAWDIVGTGFPDLPADPTSSPRERLFALDLRDTEATRDLLAAHPPDFIVHLAAQAHVPTAYSNPWHTLENNILGQLSLLEGCRALGIAPRTIVVGSSEEYGRVPPNRLPVDEDEPLRPENPYAVSKVAQDVMGYQYAVSYDLPIIRVRPFNHIGPGQSPRFVLPSFASQVAAIEAGSQPPLLQVGNLAPERDFTDVRDVVRAYRLLLEKGTPGAVYNVATGRPCAIQALLDALLARACVDIRVETDPERFRPADVPLIYGSVGRLAADTGWHPRFDLDQTIDDVLAEWRDRAGSTGTGGERATAPPEARTA